MLKETPTAKILHINNNIIYKYLYVFVCFIIFHILKTY